MVSKEKCKKWKWKKFKMFIVFGGSINSLNTSLYSVEAKNCDNTKLKLFFFNAKGKNISRF